MNGPIYLVRFKIYLIKENVLKNIQICIINVSLTILLYMRFLKFLLKFFSSSILQLRYSGVGAAIEYAITALKVMIFLLFFCLTFKVMVSLYS